jgi:putative acetyltransferase
VIGFAVRLEEPRDRDVSLEVERLAFGSDEESSIVEAVRDEEGSFALVAEEGGEIVGHVQFSRAWIGSDAAVALGPIGVRSNRQGRGIGSALIEAACEEARIRGEAAVILLGSPEFYRRFGFEPAVHRGLRNPFAGMAEGDLVIAEEDFMLRELGPGAVELTGPVRWHPSFGQGNG